MKQDKKHLQFKSNNVVVPTQSDFEEEDVEVQLEKVINRMMDSSKDRVSYTLQTDDYIDYIIVVALVIVAVGGFLMWRKLQEQKQKILL